MAAFVNDDVWFSIFNGGAVNLSAYIKSGQLTYNKQIVDVSVMGISWIKRLGGVGDWKVELEFIADYDPALTWHTLSDVLGVVAAGVYLPNGILQSATNPSFAGNLILEDLPVGGAFGDLATFNVTFLGAGALVITDT
jgi:predicted secreted protein